MGVGAAPAEREGAADGVAGMTGGGVGVLGAGAAAAGMAGATGGAICGAGALAGAGAEGSITFAVAAAAAMPGGEAGGRGAVGAEVAAAEETDDGAVTGLINLTGAGRVAVGARAWEAGGAGDGRRPRGRGASRPMVWPRAAARTAPRKESRSV